MNFIGMGRRWLGIKWVGNRLVRILMLMNDGRTVVACRGIGKLLSVSSWLRMGWKVAMGRRVGM